MAKQKCTNCNTGVLRSDFSGITFNFNEHIITSENIKYKKCNYCNMITFGDTETKLIYESLDRIINKDPKI